MKRESAVLAIALASASGCGQGGGSAGAGAGAGASASAGAGAGASASASAGAGAGAGASAGAGAGGSAGAGAAVGVVLPRDAGRFAPARVDAGRISGATITETENCAGCHADAAAQWQSSAHAFASFNNPVYRVAIDRFRRVVGSGQSRFCAGCHDIALLVDGAMAQDVAATDPRAHGGVTCHVCHGIERAEPDGNGSYTLARGAIAIPKDGDAASVALHKNSVALAPLREAAMCGSCHRAFLGPDTGNVAHLLGQDELGQWARSAYAGSNAARIDDVEPRACKDCHMPRERATLGDAAAKQGAIASHRFAGGGTWLAAMRGDSAQLDAAQAMLHGAATIDIATATRGPLTTVDVVVRNARVGHKFPGGVLDAQDTWIEVNIEDARGGVVLTSAADEPHRLRALQVDAGGQPALERETDRFATPAYDHTLAPRDAEVVRYVFDASTVARAAPLTVRARLLHRSRNAQIALAACAERSTSRGAAFARETRTRSGAIDACAPPPITRIAESERPLADVAGVLPSPFARAYDYALGLSHALGDDNDEARVAVAHALGLATAPMNRAAALQLSAEIAARSGLTDEAMRLAADAESLIGPHPAIDRVRGHALADVWRDAEATPFLRAAAEAAPRDHRAWAELAIAQTAAGDGHGALLAAARGLAEQPRDPDLLRAQSLGLAALALPSADAAERAYLSFRPFDDAPRARALCSRTAKGCALERTPLHLHRLARPTAPLPAHVRARDPVAR